MAACVDGVPLTVAQVRKAFALRRLQADGAGAVTLGQDRMAWETTLGDLTNRRLLTQAARAHHLAVFTSELDGAWRKLVSGWEPQVLAGWLAERGISALAIKEDLHETLLAQKYLRTQVLDRVSILDRDVEAYLVAHPELTAQPERVHLRHVVVADANGTRAVALAMRRAGDMAQVAQALSIAADGPQGGDLGWISRADLPASIADGVFALPRHKLGEPVARADGLHLYWVEERAAKQTLSLAHALPRAEAALRREREAAAQTEHLDALRRRAHIETFEVPFEDF